MPSNSPKQTASVDAKRHLRAACVLLAPAAVVAWALVAPSAAFAASGASAPPAGGAAIGQVIIATSFAIVMTIVLLILGLGHRSGRVTILGRVAHELGGLSGIPGWAALPVLLAGLSLSSALFGVYWDISLHVDNGRDPGPLANPAHYFILLGLFGTFAAGWFAVVLPDRKPSPAAVRIAPGWHAPLGGVLMIACACFALIGFPLDDISHRLFGQDVTLWGPTHLMMISGAVLSTFGIATLLVESSLARKRGHTIPQSQLFPRLNGLLDYPRAHRIRLIQATSGMLIGFSLYQGEFEYGIPQFRLLYDPVLVALAASLALVMARTIIGRGGALVACASFIVGRTVIALLVAGVFGQIVPHFAIYLPEALLVELAALAIAPRLHPYRFALLSGGLIATLGVAAESVWSHIWMPLPWPAHILGSAIALSVPVAIAGATLGVFIASALRLRAEHVTGSGSLARIVASVLVVGAVLGYLGHTTVPARGAGATMTLTEVRPSPHRAVQIAVRFHPASVVRGADWLNVTAWQGHGHLVLNPLRRAAGGSYHTTEPIPVYGSWKTMLRLHRGSMMASIPIYLPADAAIPAPLVPATATITRPFGADQHILQRERKRNVPSWLWSTAGLIVLIAALTLIAMIGWALRRLARSAAAFEAQTTQPPPVVPTPARTPVAAA